MDDLEIRIGRLELQPGDILVVKGATVDNAHETMRRILPSGVRVLYLPSDVDLSILTTAEIGAKSEAT